MQEQFSMDRAWDEWKHRMCLSHRARHWRLMKPDVPRRCGEGTMECFSALPIDFPRPLYSQTHCIIQCRPYAELLHIIQNVLHPSSSVIDHWVRVVPQFSMLLASWSFTVSSQSQRTASGILSNAFETGCLIGLEFTRTGWPRSPRDSLSSFHLPILGIITTHHTWYFNMGWDRTQVPMLVTWVLHCLDHLLLPPLEYPASV